MSHDQLDKMAAYVFQEKSPKRLSRNQSWRNCRVHDAEAVRVPWTAAFRDPADGERQRREAKCHPDWANYAHDCPQCHLVRRRLKTAVWSNLSTLNKHDQALHTMEIKLAHMEDRNRRCNIRVIGLDEGLGCPISNMITDFIMFSSLIFLFFCFFCFFLLFYMFFMFCLCLVCIFQRVAFSQILVCAIPKRWLW